MHGLIFLPALLMALLTVVFWAQEEGASPVVVRTLWGIWGTAASGVAAFILALLVGLL